MVKPRDWPWIPPNADLGGLCGRLLCPSFSTVELFALQE